jgi:hypothetical protein
MTSIASYMDKSSVAAADHSEKLIIYMGLVSYPSTGKTTCLRIFRDAIYEIEELTGIEPQSSRVENGLEIYFISHVKFCQEAMKKGYIKFLRS